VEIQNIWAFCVMQAGNLQEEDYSKEIGSDEILESIITQI
jgi:hypothetical protein